MKHQYKVTKTYQGCTATQSIRRYLVECEYFSAKITHYGNQGFDIPVVTRLSQCSDYFHSLNTFMKAFYQDELDQCFRDVKEGDSKVLELKDYRY